MPVCPRCRAEGSVLGGRCRCGRGYAVRRRAAAKHGHNPLLGRAFSGRFVTVDVLGEGTSGQVFEAVHRKLDRVCALKVLQLDMLDDPVQVKRFHREARAIARLSHPNLVTVFDFDVEQGDLPYIAMELADSTLLTAYQPYEGLPLAATLHILSQLAAAITEAHDHGVVHRDLKPDNISICHKSGHPYFIKVLDFGIARILTGDGQDDRVTMMGEVLGTPIYMSPEQAAGSTRIGTEADVYAFGVIAYEMLSGHPPFNAATSLATMMQHVSGEPAPLKPRRGLQISHELSSLVMRCLEKMPEDRFSTGSELLAALEETDEMQALWRSSTSLTVSPAHRRGRRPSGGRYAPPPRGRGADVPMGRPIRKVRGAG